MGVLWENRKARRLDDRLKRGKGMGADIGRK